MFWETLWALVLGFGLSGAVQAFVTRGQMERALGGRGARTLGKATFLGMVSSSCSYAATAMAKSLFQKGANFTAAMSFEIASTNLVVELGIIMALVLGWQFTVGEFVGGPLMIVLVVFLFRRLLTPRLVDETREQAERGLSGRVEGHAEMDMSVRRQGTLLQRLISREGFDATAGYFVMDWAAVWMDIFGGLLIAGALAAWVPDSFWRHLFFTGHPLAAKLWGPLIGPAISVVAFVCSIGNVPLAAVLWNGGISFGGVVSFIFADLIIVPILLIYRKYYGTRMALRLFALFYATMVAAGYMIELVFGPLGLIPATRNARAITPHISLNSDTYLNIVAIVLTLALVVRFYRTGGRPMLAMMGGSPDEPQGKQDAP